MGRWRGAGRHVASVIRIGILSVAAGSVILVKRRKLHITDRTLPVSEGASVPSSPELEATFDKLPDAIEHGLSCRQVGGTVWGERIKHEQLA